MRIKYFPQCAHKKCDDLLYTPRMRVGLVITQTLIIRYINKVHIIIVDI